MPNSLPGGQTLDTRCALFECVNTEIDNTYLFHFVEIMFRPFVVNIINVFKEITKIRFLWRHFSILCLCILAKFAKLIIKYFNNQK